MGIPAWLAGGIPRTACVAAYEPICAVSLADSYINRANPGTLDAYAGTAPTWAAQTGWVFDGFSHLLFDFTGTDDCSYIVRYSGATDSAVDKMLFGSISFNPSPGARIGFQSSFSNQVAYSQQNYVFVSPGLLSGVLAISAQQGYRDGVSDGAGISTDSTIYPTKQAIGAWRFDNGTIYGRWNGNIQALYIYNVPITPTQVRAVTDAMNMLPMRPQLPSFRSWLTGGAVTQFRKAFGLRTGSRGVPE